MIASLPNKANAADRPQRRLIRVVGQTGILMKVRKDRTDDAAAPSRREDEGQREKEVCNGRQRQEG